MVSLGGGGSGFPFSSDNPLMGVLALLAIALIVWLAVRAFET